jgi:16S rRNA (uracil1498-N3)-methyltransferase
MRASGHSGFSPRFFLDSEPVGGSELELDAEDSHHASRVLRLRQGDGCEVVTASGRVYSAVVTSTAEPVRVRLEAEVEPTAAGASYRVDVGIVQALARPSATDLVIEKGTEVGGSFFLLVRADGSPGARGKDPAKDEVGRLTRWQRIAREAAKQSKHTSVPWVGVAASVAAGLGRLAIEGIASVVLEPSAQAVLSDVVLAFPSSQARMALWVGPESGWTAREMEAFAAAGIPVARLGRGVLRTETAGLVAVAVTRLALGDW